MIKKIFGMENAKEDSYKMAKVMNAKMLFSVQLQLN